MDTLHNRCQFGTENTADVNGAQLVDPKGTKLR